MDNTQKLKTIGFCSGYLGIERGLELAGVAVQPLAYCEIEAYVVANLLAKMEAGQLVPVPIWPNAESFPVGGLQGKVDLFTGGFPCQPFSAAGKVGADSDPRHLFPSFKRFIEAVKPGRIFLENVGNIATAKLKSRQWSDPLGTPVLLHVCRELERLGYCVEAGLFTAEEVGAPHRRERWFIYGELGNPSGVREYGSRLAVPGEPQSKKYEPGDPSGEDVAVSPDNRCRERTREGTRDIHRIQKPERSGREIERCDRELAHPCCTRSQKPGNTREVQASATTSSATTTGKDYKWPARPGESQFIWEAPRTVSKPNMGRTTNGNTSKLDPTTHRVDRLRLCGNGVVPQTAAKAWLTLCGRLRNRKNGGI